MLAIEVNGEFLELGTAKVRLKLVSQVFARDFVAQGYSYPFSLPWTATNARLLGHMDRLAMVGSFAPVQGFLWLGGLKWRPCELVLRKFTGTEFDMDLRTPEDQLILDLKGRYLQDFTYGGPYDMTPMGLVPTKDDYDDLYHQFRDTIDNTDFVLAPVRNTRRFGGRNEAYLNIDPDSPAYDLNIPDEYVNYYNAVQPYDWFYFDTDPDIQVFMHEFSPFFYLAFVCEAMMKELGYALSSNILEMDEVRRQVVVGNLHLGLIVVTQGGLTSSPDNEGYRSVPVGQALPRMSAYTFWVKLMKRYCAVIKVRNNRFYFTSINSIINSNENLDLTEHTEPADGFEPDEQDGYELTAVQEPLERRDAPQALPTDTILGTVDAVADLSSLTPSTGDIAFVSNENAYYQYSVGSGSPGWQFYSHNLYPAQSGAQEVKLDIGVALTRMYRGQDSVNTTRSWLVPWFDQGMSDTIADWHMLGDNKVSELRLLYFRGMQQDSEAETYPLLTNGTQDYAGNTITGAEHTERIDGTGGIYETWYSQWVQVLQKGRTAERRVRLPVHLLLSFDFTQKVRIDNITYLVKSIDVEVTTNGIGLATLELVML